MGRRAPTGSTVELSALKTIANGCNELGGRNSVKGPMVPGQTECQNPSPSDPPFFVPDRLVANPSYAQNRRVGRVDDRRKAVDSVHPEGGDGECSTFYIR